MAVSVISFFAPSEIAYSRLTTTTEKEKPLQRLEKTLKNVVDEESNASDTEKTKLEKSIIKSQKEIKKLQEKKARGEKLNEEEISSLVRELLFLQGKKREWVEK
ncbi:MAG: hypothetical protein NY202_05490 [Mollicutes bacterium UO1]